MRRYIQPSDSSPLISIIPNISSPRSLNTIFPWGNDNFIGNTCQNFPTYFRTLTPAIPNSPELEALSKLPYGIVVEPGTVGKLPRVDLSNSTIPRCNKCQAYISCFCKVDERKKQWICGLCGAKTNFPENMPEIPQMLTGNMVYDVVAPQDYVQKAFVMPSFVFIIDLSSQAVDSGFTAQFIRSVKSSVEQLSDKTNVCVMTITKFASIYDIKACKEVVVIDPEDFVVSPNYIVTLRDCRKEFNKLLDLLLKKHSHGQGNCLGSAYAIACSALRIYGGIIIAGTCTTPSIGPYAVASRVQGHTTEDSEIQLLHIPKNNQCKKYMDLALLMSKRGISLHLFICSKSHAEVAVSGLACGLTGGLCRYYKEFDPLQLHSDLFVSITSRYLWNASMRLRESDGIQQTKIFGNMTNFKDGISIAVLPSNASLTFGLTVKKPINNAKFQAALLFTSSTGKRILRVFNFEIPVTSEISVLQSGFDEAALGTFLVKSATLNILSAGSRDSMEGMNQAFWEIVNRNSKFKSLHHIIFGILKNRIFTESILPNIDYKMAAILNLRMTSVSETILYAYPMLYDIENKKTLALRIENIASGIFALGCYNNILLWCTNPLLEEEFRNLVDENNEPKGNLVDFVTNIRQLTGKYLRIIVLSYETSKEYIDSLMIETSARPNFNSWITSQVLT
ncbi:Sec23/Sec24 trunk domain containing protein [Trichomonas vaginalis G3]|uniref:Sec23/Sec24 trunk domain containing protein n=1 Tax=Trichomonas vaginalis (strain ATCC PRA-98 / G3) TaxID=412133 RepID=A2DW95_TRIV3|nr:ER to Golgi vesicle-mediated transport [Trichomonas vaginalis G3]EAY15396.1 Sec23/Sec24 trunk domain containing protein [Trichomonas vaginalis G3]KAI5496729.1 ER to Golgi vesicle-mediated transport [Trichomonas vaginalis G3]|eukprot:XP_001327619.1 Sec23/Sec24 trunk domain containing protein [Trichomonas vaginalis G3]